MKTSRKVLTVIFLSCALFSVVLFGTRGNWFASTWAGIAAIWCVNTYFAWIAADISKETAGIWEKTAEICKINSETWEKTAENWEKIAELQGIVPLQNNSKDQEETIT